MMNQRPVNFSKKYRRSRMAADSGITPDIRRQILVSVEDLEQLAAESSRARLVQKVTKPEEALPRDFAAYFHSSKKNNDPDYIITSHHTREPLPKRRPVISTYPCTQSLRWNPYVETSSIDEEPSVAEATDFTKSNCKCKSCTTESCPSRSQPTSAEQPSVFRDNIMTFCDRHTMTPMLNEIGCGSTPVPSTRVSDVSVTTSDIAVKDTQASMEIHQLYSPERCPASILKNNRQSHEEYSCYSWCCGRDLPVNLHQEPERDFDADYIEPSKCSSIKSFFKCKKKKNGAECSAPRRIIYNEGISDQVALADRIPVPPVKVPSPLHLKKGCSKASVRSRCCLNEPIPFSHRSDSRYHHNCKHPNSRSYYGDSDEIRHLMASSNFAKKSIGCKPVKYLNPPLIKMPRRVLTSERDIESYIDRDIKKVIPPAQAVRCRRGN